MLPFSELCKIVDGFVGHAGHGTVDTMLSTRTPMLLIPRFGDQCVNAEII